MKGADIRQFTRVNFSQAAQLKFGVKKYDPQLISNISLGGMFIKGEFNQQPEDICSIEVSHALPAGQSFHFRAKGRAVRCAEDGLAVKFISMEHDSLQFLQTALLYQADDPADIGTEFGKDLSFQLTQE